MASNTETAGAGRRSRKRTRGRHETCNNNACCQEGPHYSCNATSNNSRTIASRSRLALTAVTILLLGGQNNNNNNSSSSGGGSNGMGVVVDAAVSVQSEKGIHTDDVNNDVHVSPSDTASGTGSSSSSSSRTPTSTTNTEVEEQQQQQRHSTQNNDQGSTSSSAAAPSTSLPSRHLHISRPSV